MAYSDNLPTLLAALNGLTEAEKFNISSVIFTETFRDLNIKDNHPTITGVRGGSKVPILLDDGGYGGFPFTAGDCTLPACDISSTWSEYTWDLGQIGCEVTICIENFSNDFLTFFNTWKKMNEGDIESALVQFIIERFQRQHLKAEIRVAYFGDSSSTDTLINGFDGFFVQMQALATADPSLSVEITENAGIDVASQTIAGGQDVYNYLTTMYEQAAEKPWFSPADMVWRMDEGLVNKLVGWLNVQSDLKGVSCDCIDPSKVQNARLFAADNISIFGIPIEPLPFLKAMQPVAELYDPATGLYTDKNRIILARREAMVLGYETEETLNRFDVGYDKRANEIYIQGASLFGVGVPVPYFILAI